MRKLFIVLGFLTVCVTLNAQELIQGKVINGSTGEPLPNVNILTAQASGTTSDANGIFRIPAFESGEQRLRLSHVGFFPEEIIIKANQKAEIEVTMMPSPANAGAVVITATRTPRKLNDLPGQVDLVTSRQLQSLPMQQIDDALKVLPGVNIGRERGILDHNSTVSMRGLGGDQQGRFLVLLDGVPMNKADGGSVNWNLINTDDIRQIELSKGPASSIYGGHAMGGVINLISQQPSKPLEGKVSLDYGSFQTMKGRFSVGGSPTILNNKFYWGLNGFRNLSDGYINVPEEDRDSTVIATPLKEWGAGARFGYRINNQHQIEWNSSFWHDFRGSGTRIYDPEGTFFGHDVWSHSLKYSGRYERANWELQVYSQAEDYQRLTESVKESKGTLVYTAYDVTSARIDQGANARISISRGKHRVTAGGDLKYGIVDGNDIYRTSSDVVTNQGKTSNVAAFVQDEFDLIHDRLSLIGGLRFDHVRFFDGHFFITDPTSATSILKELENLELEDNVWQELSPKLALNFNPAQNWSLYASYGHGFRPSILDDLCRSGFIRGGFKRANPFLGPESLNNFELGTNFQATPKITIHGSLYYTLGHDFIYLIGTGDTIMMGTKGRPVLEARNITGVEILGSEVSVKWNIISGLDTWLHYSFNRSVISDTGDSEEISGLIGKYLMYVPDHKVTAGFSWLNRFVNVMVQGYFIGEQWMDDANTQSIPGHITLDARLWRDIRGFQVFINGHNLTNEVHLEGHGQLSMGRFISAGLSYQF